MLATQTQTMRQKLLPGANEEVYVYLGFKHGFVRMTMPGRAAPHLVDMRKAVETQLEWCARECACDEFMAAYVIGWRCTSGGASLHVSLDVLSSPRRAGRVKLTTSDLPHSKNRERLILAHLGWS
jgi:hypothetical protein